VRCCEAEAAALSLRGDDVRRTRNAGILLLAVIVWSCSIFPPRPEPNFFILTPVPDDESSSMNMAGSPPGSFAPIELGLGPVRFPAYLDRLEMVTRIEENRLAISDTNRWAAPLDVAFTRILAQDLSSRMPDSRVALYPWYNDHVPDFQIIIDVQRFDLTVQGLARLEAAWTISDPKANALLYSTSSAFTQSMGGIKPGDPAAALSHTVADLSSQIAGRVEQIGARSR
jgi:uncharacterized lipoprotein YmbA